MPPAGAGASDRLVYDSSISADSTASRRGKDTGEIHGRVWNDLDGDGVHDAGELGLQAWTIYLDENQDGQWDIGESRATTDINGDCSFSNLKVGTYTVAEVCQSGWIRTSPSDLSFAGPVNVGTGDHPHIVTAAEFHNDDDLDLAVTRYREDGISVLQDSGTGTFAAPVDYAVGDHPLFVAACDLDGDGHPDLAVADQFYDSMTVLLMAATLCSPRWVTIKLEMTQPPWHWQTRMVTVTSTWPWRMCQIRDQLREPMENNSGN